MRRGPAWHSDVMDRIPGITYRKLDYWCRVGVLAPKRGAQGSGSRREFSENDVRCLRAVEQASRAGVHRETLKVLADHVRMMPGAQFALIRPIDRDGASTARSNWHGRVELLNEPRLVTDLALIVPLWEESHESHVV